MRRLFAALLLLCAMSAFSAQAEIEIDDVRLALDERDYSTLEEMFAEAHATALADKNFFPLRNTYSVLFVTANKDRQEKAEAWFAAYPRSPYAATGLVWMHYKRAFLLRGGGWAGDTSPEALQGFHDELAMAKELTDFAIAQADDFLPAIDAAILLRQTHIDEAPAQELVDHALNIAPDRHALRLGLAAANLYWGGEMEENLSLCGFMATKIPDYDSELCLIEFAFQNNLQGTFREMAVEALAGRDEEFLDYARLDAYLNEWVTHADAAEQAKRIHRASLGPEVDFGLYEKNLRSIVATFQLPFYEIEAGDALLKTLRDRLKDSPQDHHILKILVEDILERGLRGEYDAKIEDAAMLWREMLELGAYLPHTWRLGAQISYPQRSRLEGIEWRGMFHANQIYYGNHDPFWLKAYLSELFQSYMFATGEMQLADGDDTDLGALGDAVMCPMFRVARLYQFVCDADPTAAGCNVGGWGSDFPDRVRRIMKTSTQCTQVREAEIEELVFSPVPIERFFEESTQ